MVTYVNTYEGNQPSSVVILIDSVTLIIAPLAYITHVVTSNLLLTNLYNPSEITHIAAARSSRRTTFVCRKLRQ